MKKMLIGTVFLSLAVVANSWGEFVITKKFCDKYHILNSPYDDSRVSLYDNSFQLFGEATYGVKLFNNSEENIYVTCRVATDGGWFDLMQRIIPNAAVTIKGIQGAVTIVDHTTSKTLLVKRLFQKVRGKWIDACLSEDSSLGGSYRECFEPSYLGADS